MGVSMVDMFRLGTAVTVCLAVIALCYTLIVWASDTREWNGGKCPCGQPWQRLGNDAKRRHSYACFNPECDDHIIQISSPWVDHNYQEDHSGNPAGSDNRRKHPRHVVRRLAKS